MENNFTVPDDYLNSDKRVEGGLILLTLNEEENKKNLKPVVIKLFCKLRPYLD